MTKKSIVAAIFAFAAVGTANAGGMLTNTNQNIAFNRMMSREGSIAIDGVYSNPAGVAFMDDGYHLSINWQMATQTRTIENDYPLFRLNANAPTTPRKFEGKAFAPVIPSIQMAYNKGDWSYQVGFGVNGGGGKCEFDNGLGSFERIVANAAAVMPSVAAGLDRIGQGVVGPQFGTPMSDMFPKGSKYTYESFMRGRQYYFGLQLGAAYKFSDQLSAYAGVRGVYADCTYYGYVKNITINGHQLSGLLGGEGRGDIELNCDQTGLGFMPILGVDFKLNKHWNFSARYEFKTRMRLKNKSVNQVPDMASLGTTIGDMVYNGIYNKATIAGMPVEQATMQATGATKQIMAAAAPTLTELSATLSQKIGGSLSEYQDGTKIAQDIPALLTIGAGYTPIDQVRINAGFHYFYDRQATSHGNRNRLLSRGTIEWNAGVEGDVCKKVTLSAGWQRTNYGTTDKYMDDKSFVTSSHSVGVGGVYHLNDKVDINLAYFCTFYQHHKTCELDDITKLPYSADYTRTNNAFGLGVDVKF